MLAASADRHAHLRETRLKFWNQQPSKDDLALCYFLFTGKFNKRIKIASNH